MITTLILVEIILHKFGHQNFVNKFV